MQRSWGGRIQKPGALKQLEETCLTGAWKWKEKELRGSGSGGEKEVRLCRVLRGLFKDFGLLLISNGK